jgi:hypothetical protein
MKRKLMLLFVGAALAAASTMASARNNVSLGVYVGPPVYPAPVYAYPPPPVYYGPPPVYYPGRVYYGPAYYGPAYGRFYYGPPHRGWYRHGRRW